MVLHVLYANPISIALFEVKEIDEVAADESRVKRSLSDFALFSRIVSFEASQKYKDADERTAVLAAMSRSEIPDMLRTFLETNVDPKDKQNILGTTDMQLATELNAKLGYSCRTDDLILSLLRGIRTHFNRFTDDESVDLDHQLSLAHSYSRTKVSTSAEQTDVHIGHMIELVDTLDKDINSYAMRIKDWYAKHFPELTNLVKDPITFARIALTVGDRSKFLEERSEEALARLNEILPGKTEALIESAAHSMGQDLSEADFSNITCFAEAVLNLAESRHDIFEEMQKQMHEVAPNVTGLVGEQIGARLMARAGGMTALAKMAASTVQILGAEKALFRAIKKRSNTPKYGLIYHASLVGRSQPKHKGRVSRTLANKIVLAARVDAFSEEFKNGVYAEKVLRPEVEDRLSFFGGKGDAPLPTGQRMKELRAENPLPENEVVEEVEEQLEPAVTKEKKEKKEKKSKDKKKDKKEKKDRKEKKKSKKEKKKSKKE